jgi:hypothetical protein
MATTRKRVRNGRLTWEVRWYDPDRRLRGKTFARKVDAERFRASVEVDKLAGTYADPAAGKTPLAAWAEQWQATTVHLRPSTRARDKMLLDRFVLPRFGRRRRRRPARPLTVSGHQAPQGRARRDAVP